MKNSFLILVLFVTTLFVNSCTKTADVAPTPSLVGVWKYKTARMSYDDAAGKTIMVDVAPKASTGVEFKASDYVITGSNQPFTVTKLGQTQTIQIKSSTYKINTVDEIAAEIIKGSGFTATEKTAFETSMAALKKEGITHVATLGDVEFQSKTSSGSFSLGWDWYSIRTLTANQLVLEFFGDDSPAAERWQITLEK
jgi:hypothetical protein